MIMAPFNFIVLCGLGTHPEIFLVHLLAMSHPFPFHDLSFFFFDAIFQEALARGEQCLHHVLIHSCDLSAPQIAMCLHVQRERNDGTLCGY